jgi:predicted N-acyltransferase
MGVEGSTPAGRDVTASRPRVDRCCNTWRSVGQDAWEGPVEADPVLAHTAVRSLERQASGHPGIGWFQNHCTLLSMGQLLHDQDLN